MNLLHFIILAICNLPRKKVQNWLKHTSVHAKANSRQLYILCFESWFSQHIKSIFPRDLFSTSMPCLVTYTWTFEPDGKIWTCSFLSCHRMPRGELCSCSSGWFPWIPSHSCDVVCIPLMSLRNQNNFLKRSFFWGGRGGFHIAVIPRMWSLS